MNDVFFLVSFSTMDDGRWRTRSNQSINPAYALLWLPLLGLPVWPYYYHYYYYYLLLHLVARTHGLKCLNGWMNGWMDGHFPFVVLSMRVGFLICTFVLLLPRSLKCPLMSKEEGRTDGWTWMDKVKCQVPGLVDASRLTANETWTMTMQSLMLHARDKTKQKRKK